MIGEFIDQPNRHQGANSSMLQLHCTAALEGVDLGKASQLASSKLKKILRERVHMSAWRIWMNMTQIACVMCKVRASPSADSPRGSQKPTGACTPNSPARSLASQKNQFEKEDVFMAFKQYLQSSKYKSCLDPSSVQWIKKVINKYH